MEKKIIEYNLCLICKLEKETVIHILWTCPATNDVWAERASPVQKWNRSEVEFLHLWEKLIARLKRKEVELAAIILKRTWLRNKFVFDNQFEHLNSIICRYQHEREEFKGVQDQLQLKGLMNKCSRQEVRWAKLRGLNVKVNWDVVVNFEAKKVGVGVIVKDS